MTSFGLCNLVADYYVAHRQWPITRGQLDEQMQQWVARDKAQMSPDEIHDASTFLDRFALLEPREHGRNLVFHYRFKIDQKTVDQTVTFRPGPTSDEILQSMIAGDHS